MRRRTGCRPRPGSTTTGCPTTRRRLYALLGVTRGDIWRQLRDDRHNLAELPRRTAGRRPTGWRRRWSRPARRVAPATLRALPGRALRTITQGHLAQHLFFHSLHQFAIPSEAPDDLRRDRRASSARCAAASSARSTIGRVHGRSPAQVQALATAMLRERVARRRAQRRDAGAAGAGCCSRRQLAQVPRWLAQARYNGPPPTTTASCVAAAARLRRQSGDLRRRPPRRLRGLRAPAAGAGARRDQRRAPTSLGGSAPVGARWPTAARRRVGLQPVGLADGRLVAFESADGNPTSPSATA